MSGPVIHVDGLGKQYRLGRRRQRHDTLRDALTAWVRELVLRHAGGPAPETIWALRGVSFDVHRGEVIGIVGRNGAGKSTLLKLLSRITEPTTGAAFIRGRVGSLLDVGTGFHPELTGRENIQLSGAILGMRRAETARKFDEIVAFAEVEPFLDTPVKHYSSGMYLRLAFAVAAHLEPSILMVDEVLAVGDAAFQKKCLGKMDDVARGGRTVLFVSHNLVAVESLCRRVLWLDGGQLVRDGGTRAVLGEYLRTTSAVATERVWPTATTAPGDKALRLHRVGVRPADGTPASAITVHTSFLLEFEYWNEDPSAYVSVSISVYDEKQTLLFDVCPPLDPDWRRHPSPTGLLRTVCHVPGDFLNDGRHRVALIVLRNHVPVIRQPDALVFDIQDSIQERDGWYGKWPGAIRPRLRWQVDMPATARDVPADDG